MKTISTQLSYIFKNKKLRQNFPLLLRYIGILIAVIALFSVMFHFIMLYEGEDHSWITGVYWTLTVMSTLGFGDITFASDLGRAFSVLVLMTGIVMLLIVLPFAFIRFFYAPWLETQIQNRAPRKLSPDIKDHIIICAYDSLASGLVEWCERENIPYVVIEPDPSKASDLHLDGLSVIVGDRDNQETYEKSNVNQARMVLANCEDVVNTNITLTVREVSEDVPLTALSSDPNAEDILQLSGATNVLSLKKRLGQQLVNRVITEWTDSYSIGEYNDLKVAEIPVHHTSLAGKTIGETQLRNQTGVNIIGVSDQGPIEQPLPDKELTETSVLLMIGTEKQLDNVKSLLSKAPTNESPLLLIGGGTIGRAAAKALKSRGISFNLLEKKPGRCRELRNEYENVFEGDASNYEMLKETGLEDASAVLLTTNDDAMNIYLTSYCRRLNPNIRIVSRITHQRNLDAIYRAGADFVLSYDRLGVEVITSIIGGEELLVLGEKADVFTRPVPPTLVGKSLSESKIGAQSGLNVIALNHNEETITDFSANIELLSDMEMVLVGSDEQLDQFIEQFEP